MPRSHASSTTSRRAKLLPVFVIGPRRRRSPRECSPGTKPRYAINARAVIARVTDRAHLVGVADGPRPAETEAVRPKPALLRPLNEYAAVAGGSF